MAIINDGMKTKQPEIDPLEPLVPPNKPKPTQANNAPAQTGGPAPLIPLEAGDPAPGITDNTPVTGGGSPQITPPEQVGGGSVSPPTQNTAPQTGGGSPQTGNINDAFALPPPKGIVNSALATSNTKTTQPQANNGAPPAAPVMRDIQANTREVGRNETVRGQLDDLLKQDSEYMARARASAAGRANDRGLQNSSMAMTAGEAAAYDAALPIATSDATTYARQGLANQDATNQFLGMDKGADIDLRRQYAGFEQSDYMADKEAAVRRELTKMGIDSNEKISEAQMNEARANANASMAAAAHNAALEREWRMKALESDERRFNQSDATQRYSVDQQLANSREANLTNLRQNAQANYSAGLNNIMTAQMEPDARQNALRNYNAIWVGSPYLPFEIDMSKFPPATTPAPAPQE
jgi:hypothetical protein